MTYKNFDLMKIISNIRDSYIQYLEKTQPGKAESTYKTYASDSKYLLNNGYEDEYIRFMRADEDMSDSDTKDVITNILTDAKRKSSRIQNDCKNYYKVLCWQREYINKLGGIDYLLKEYKPCECCTM